MAVSLGARYYLVGGGLVRPKRKGSYMLRSEFLALVPVTVWTAACGDSEPRPQLPAGAGGGGAGTSGSGGVSAQEATGGSTAGAGGASGSSSGKGGTGGSASSTAGTGAGPAQGGSGGAAPAACLNVEKSIGAFALASDFSINSDTGQKDEHTLDMWLAAMLRQQLDYQTTGEDHAHTIVFTVAQLGALMGGQTVVVETEGPPLNASSGHSHTVTIHPCPGAKL